MTKINGLFLSTAVSYQLLSALSKPFIVLSYFRQFFVNNVQFIVGTLVKFRRRTATNNASGPSTCYGWTGCHSMIFLDTQTLDSLSVIAAATVSLRWEDTD